MLPSVGAEIAIFGFLDQSQRVPANISQFTEHNFLSAQELGINGYRRFQANHSPLHKREGQVNSLKNRNRLWLLSENPRGRRNYHTLYRRHVGYDRSGRPAAFPGTDVPKFRRNRIGRAQQAGLRTGKLLVNSSKSRHGVLATNRNWATRYSRAYNVAPPAASKACATCSTRPSPKGGPKICSPTGNFPETLPHGTEIPGTPAKDPVTV
jgi:hypothetical protein